MTELYGRGEGTPDRTVMQLTFYGLRVQSIVFDDGAGEKRTLPMVGLVTRCFFAEAPGQPAK